jgi:hypothetical protein
MSFYLKKESSRFIRANMDKKKKARKPLDHLQTAIQELGLRSEHLGQVPAQIQRESGQLENKSKRLKAESEKIQARARQIGQRNRTASPGS